MNEATGKDEEAKASKAPQSPLKDTVVQSEPEDKKEKEWKEFCMTHFGKVPKPDEPIVFAARNKEQKIVVTRERRSEKDGVLNVHPGYTVEFYKGRFQVSSGDKLQLGDSTVTGRQVLRNICSSQPYQRSEISFNKGKPAEDMAPQLLMKQMQGKSFDDLKLKAVEVGLKDKPGEEKSDLILRILLKCSEKKK